MWNSRLTILAVALMLAGGTAQGALIFTDLPTFLAELQPGYYLEDYSTYSWGSQGQTMNFSQGGFSYSASAPLDLWINTAIGNSLSTVHADDAISFTFTSGNVTAVGGYFFPTDVSEQLIVGDVVLTLSDGTVQVLNNPGTASFVGFITTGGVLITSLTVDAPDTIEYSWPTVDDFYVGAAGDAIPEPSTFLLLTIGAGGLLLMRRKLRRQ
ncbi:MAG: PEP-CTERM sorting domain-containing protein [Bryobacteraceae bacterium]